MAYRSDIAIYHNAEAAKRLHAEFKDVEKYLAGLAKKKTEVEDGGELYRIIGVKWYVGYSQYEDVDAIDDFLGKLDWEKKDERYEFMRLGEDDDDTEHRWTVDEPMMWVERYINTDNYCETE